MPVIGLMEKKCSKITYESAEQARKDAKVIHADLKRHSKKRVTRPVARLTPYQCKHCGKFHLTSKRQKLFKTGNRF